MFCRVCLMPQLVFCDIVQVFVAYPDLVFCDILQKTFRCRKYSILLQEVKLVTVSYFS